MSEEILYRVESDGKMHSFRVTLGVGSHVNVRDQTTGLTMHMINRANFNVSPQAAWHRHSLALTREIEYIELFVIKALQFESSVRHITTTYSRKDDDLANAQSKVDEWVNRLRDKRTEQQAAALRSTDYSG